VPKPGPPRKTSQVKRQPLFPASSPDAFLAVENSPSSQADIEARLRRSAFARTNSSDTNNNLEIDDSKSAEQKGNESLSSINFLFPSNIKKSSVILNIPL